MRSFSLERFRNQLEYTYIVQYIFSVQYNTLLEMRVGWELNKYTVREESWRGVEQQIHC